MYQYKSSPLQKIILKNTEIDFYVKRDDLLHPHISGNKWRKMKYNLEEMKRQGKSCLLTFGGAFSNHIAASAAAGEVYGFKTIGIIRGEEMKPLNSTLTYAAECGMQLEFVTRTAYRKKNDFDFLEKLKQQYGDFYILPEGGTNCFALPGCAEIIAEVKQEITPDYWCVSCGTGGTIAGMISGLNNESQVLGFSALKGDFLIGEVKQLLQDCRGQEFLNWEIQTDFHFGGYAKWKPELLDFIKKFKKEQGVSLDPIYTGKMFFGIFELIEKGFFKPGSTIVAVHTGGLQGIAGFNQRFGTDL